MASTGIRTFCRRASVWMVLAVYVCSFLASCGTVPKETEPASPADPLPESGTESEAETEPVSGPISLSMLKDPGRGLFSNTVTTEEGLYKLRIDTAGTSVLYYDYETMVLDYLAPRLDATSDAYDAGIPSGEGGTIPAVDGDYLYVLSVGQPPVMDFDGWQTKVFQLELDGSGQKELTLPRDLLLSKNSGIVGDGSGIYILTRALNRELREYQDYVLLRVGSEMEEAREIARFPYENVFSVDLYGAYGSELIFRTAVPQSGYEDAKKEEQFGHLAYTWTRFDVLTGEETAFFQYEDGDCSIAYDNASLLYYCGVDSREIRCCDLAAKEDRLCVSADDLFELEENMSIRVFDPVCGGRFGIVVIREEPYETRHLYYDPSSGDWSEIRLFYYEDGAECPVSIEAETENCFIVVNGSVWYSETQVIDGVTAEVPRIEKYLSVISKEDYWNNRKVFRQFENHVFPEDAEIKSENKQLV